MQEIRDGAGTGICDGAPSTCSSCLLLLFWGVLFLLLFFLEGLTSAASSLDHTHLELLIASYEDPFHLLIQNQVCQVYRCMKNFRMSNLAGQ